MASLLMLADHSSLSIQSGVKSFKHDRFAGLTPETANQVCSALTLALLMSTQLTVDVC